MSGVGRGRGRGWGRSGPSAEAIGGDGGGPSGKTVGGDGGSSSPAGRGRGWGLDGPSEKAGGGDGSGPSAVGRGRGWGRGGPPAEAVGGGPSGTAGGGDGGSPSAVGRGRGWGRGGPPAEAVGGGPSGTAGGGDGGSPSAVGRGRGWGRGGPPAEAVGGGPSGTAGGGVGGSPSAVGRGRGWGRGGPSAEAVGGGPSGTAGRGDGGSPSAVGRGRGWGQVVPSRKTGGDGPSGIAIGHADSSHRPNRGGARGRGREGTAARRFDYVPSKPEPVSGREMTKQGKHGTAVKLEANYFTVQLRPKWAIYHYRVDFKPDETDTRLKKMLMRPHAQSLGINLFDGSSLYSPNRLHPDPMQLYSLHPYSQEKIELTVRMVAQLAPTDATCLQVYNVFARKCLQGMGLQEVGRNFYDQRQAIRLEGHRLELWPGFITTMRHHENSILLGVEVTHKVLRLDNCLQVINEIRRRTRNDQNRITNEIVGAIVMTGFNCRTYQVDDIDWGLNPTSTFDLKGTKTTFADYYHNRYNIIIQDRQQPLLVSRPKKRDLHRGQSGPILLIPELCRMTGLTDEMRANYQLMQVLATHLHTDPNTRVVKLNAFMKRLKTNPQIVDELNQWGFKFQNNLIQFQGHVCEPEKILFGGGKCEIPNDRYDWSAAFRDKPMLSSVPLNKWVIIYPGAAMWCVDKIVTYMQRVSKPLHFMIANPLELIKISGDQPHEYVKAIDEVMNKYKGNVQLLFVILPRQVVEAYSAIKKRASLEFGVPSQCFVAKTAQNDKRLMSVCTKLVVQMNAKLGGVPWKVAIPPKDLMVVGFDAHHTKKTTGRSIGAMVASTSETHGKYFSTSSSLSTRTDLSENVCADFTKCLHAWKRINGQLPDKIIFYRDGVGQGQLVHVFETELSNIKAAIHGIYQGAERAMPKFMFIVVTKRLNTRIFKLETKGQGHVNPSPGTVVDDVITYPERYDFYLVAQHSRLGTVSPVSYNVLYDSFGLDAGRIQLLTYKLCHMYFNWSGTVSVPAPCQYAHKLAYLTGVSLGGPAHERLSNLLHFL